MQKIVVHVAMVLLGMTLTVGFYEGRRLVKNTAKAFEAATSIGTTSTRRTAREERAAAVEGGDADPRDLALPTEPLSIRTGADQAAIRTRPRQIRGITEPGAEPRGGKRGRRRGARAGTQPGELAAGARAKLDEFGGPPPVEGDVQDTGAP